MIRSRRWYLIAGSVIVAALLFIALFADQITAVSPHYWDVMPSVLQGGPPFPPSRVHLLGTDQFGRDIWSRIAYGTRWSLLFALLIMAGRMLLAVPMAVAAAFGPRLAGWLVERLYVATNAIPPLLVYLLILSVPSMRTIGLKPSVAITVTILTLVEWPRLAAVLRGRLEELGSEQFVEGAVAAGATPWRIFWAHLMPHLWPTLLQLTAAEMGRSLLTVAQLGIFGVWTGGGVIELIDDGHGGDMAVLTTGIPEWGTLLSDARYYILSAPWIPFSPAFAFFAAVTGFHMLSQGLEGAVFSIQRWKEAALGLLPRRRLWHWALLLVPVLGLLWYAGGLAVSRATPQQALVVRPGSGRNQAGDPYTVLRGFHVDVEAIYDPVDPRQESVPLRWNVHRIATAADQAYDRLRPFFADLPAGFRPRVRLYPTHAAFLQALPPDVAARNPAIWFAPGGPVRVSPDLLKRDAARQAVVRAISYELLEYMAGTRPVSPVVMGAYELVADQAPRYKIDFYAMVDLPLKPLPELFGVRLEQLTQEARRNFAVQSAVLAEFLDRQGLPRETMLRLGSLDELAQALHMGPAELSGKYETYLWDRIADESMLTVPAVRSRIPEEIIASVADREKRTPDYHATVLDADPKGGAAQVYLLEQTARGLRVVLEQWVQQGGHWLAPGEQAPQS